MKEKEIRTLGQRELLSSDAINQAVKKRSSPSFLGIYLMVCAMQHKVPPMGSETHSEKMYVDSTIRFNFMDLGSLSPDEFEDFKRDFEFRVLESFSAEGLTVSDKLQKVLSPGSPANLFTHEMQHISLLKGEIKLLSVIDVTFMDAGGVSEFPFVAGTVWLPYDKLSDYERAMVYSEPEVLSGNDVQGAIMFAERTKNKKIKALIRERIRQRQLLEEI